MMSRRAALTAIGVTPVALMAGRAAQASEVAAMIDDKDNLPQDVNSDIDHVIDTYARKYAKERNVRFEAADRRKYKRVAGALWQAFTRGVDFHNSETGDEIEIKPQFIRSLFRTPEKKDEEMKTNTGQKLVDNLTNFEGDFESGLALETALCAFKCGYLSARNAAKTDKKGKIELSDYDDAWVAVKNQQMAKHQRLSGGFEVHILAGGC